MTNCEDPKLRTTDAVVIRGSALFRHSPFAIRHSRHA
jgi:hypothetical protein